MSGISEVDLGSIVGEVSYDNAEVDEASEDTCAKSSNGRRCYLGDVNGANNRSLSNTKACNETAGVDSTEVATISHEDGDAQDP